MKTVTPAMQALFARRQWFTAKLFTFTLIDGTVLNYCSGDQDLVSAGVTYSCSGTSGPYWDRADNKAKTHWGIGTRVDTMSLDVIPGSGLVEGFPFLLAVRYGIFEGADFLYQRVNMAAPGDTSAGAIVMFGGRVGEIAYSNSVATFTINSHLELLDIQLPRNLYQAGCNNTLFDTSCTLSQAAFAVAGSVGNSPAPLAYQFAVTGPAAASADTYFNLGKILFTSGQNAGRWRTVQNFSNPGGGQPPQLAVFPPYAFVPTVGDTFTAYPGCDKSQGTCQTKFANLANFRGFPFVPIAETAL